MKPIPTSETGNDGKFHVRENGRALFMRTFLERNHRKNPSLFEVGYFQKLQENRDEFVKNEICKHHSGKIDMGIFWDGEWYLKEIQKPEELGNLVCLSGEWTKRRGLIKNDNLRTLSNFVKNAHEIGYFEIVRDLDDEEYMKRMTYFNKFKKEFEETGKIQTFIDIDRIVLRRTTKGEYAENGNAEYYLHDGLGRMLPLFYLITYHSVPLPEIHVLIAENDLAFYSPRKQLDQL